MGYFQPLNFHSIVQTLLNRSEYEDKETMMQQK